MRTYPINERPAAKSMIEVTPTIIRDTHVELDAVARFQGEDVVIAVRAEDDGQFIGWNLYTADLSRELVFVPAARGTAFRAAVMRAHAAAIVSP